MASAPSLKTERSPFLDLDKSTDPKEKESSETEKSLLDSDTQNKIQALTKQNIPVKVLSEFPKTQIETDNDKVFVVDFDEEKESGVLKVRKLDPFVYSDLSAQTLEDSTALFKMLKSQAPSQHLMAAKSLCFVQKIKQWGIIFEKIEGENWKDYFKRKKDDLGKTVSHLVQAAKGFAQGLQILDHAGWHHRDVKNDNVMIRADGSAVVIDPPWEPSSDAGSRQIGRLSFGKTINESLIWAPKSTEKTALTNLVNNCISTKSIDEYGWGQVVEELEKIDIKTS